MRRNQRSTVRRVLVTVVAMSAALLPALATSGASAGSDRSIRPEMGRLRDAPDRGDVGRVRGSEAPEAPGVPVSQSALRSLKGATASSQGIEKLRGSARPRPEPGVPVNTNSFGGITRASSSTLNPPDTTVAKSPTRVLEAVNSRLRLTTTTGGLLGDTTLNSFFGASSARGFVFDPKVYYDRSAAVNDRYYVVALQVAGNGDSVSSNDFSRIHIAVSRSTNPGSLASGSWCKYFINGVRNPGTVNQSWADFPGLGISNTGMLITTNQFRFAGTQRFAFAIARILNKNVLANNAASCPLGSSVEVDTYQPAGTAGNASYFTLQPAQHYTLPSSFADTSNPAYLVSTPFGTDNTYRAYRIRNFPGASSMNQVVNTGSFTYGVPPDSPGGSRGNIDTGDNRVLQVAAVGNQLSAAHTTGCQFTASTPMESCARVVRFKVGQTAGGAMTSMILQQNTFGLGDNNFVSYPGVALNNALATAVPFQGSGSGIPLTPIWASKTNAAASFAGALLIGPAGTCALNTGFDPNKGAYRAGDYSGAQTDTDGVGFWLAGERATSIGGLCQWATHIVRGTV